VAQELPRVSSLLRLLKNSRLNPFLMSAIVKGSPTPANHASPKHRAAVGVREPFTVVDFQLETVGAADAMDAGVDVNEAAPVEAASSEAGTMWRPGGLCGRGRDILMVVYRI
jgi:hypothetical protein